MNLYQKIRDITKNIEGSIVGCFFDNPELLYDYDELTHNDFFNAAWKIYFTILKRMIGEDIRVFQESDIELFLSKQGNEQLLDKYNEYGKFKTLEMISGLFDKENLEGYINQQKKWVAFYNLSKTLTIDDGTVDKVMDLDINQLYDYYNAQFNNIFINVSEDVLSTNLDEGLLEIIDEADKGVTRGINIPSPILNNQINGITRGQIMLIGGQSGSGKTTMLINTILSAVFENEEPAVLFLNEQDHKKIKMEMMTWIINNKIIKENEKPFRKVRWRDGNFTEEERELMTEAARILTEKMQGNKIVIVEFKTYTHKTVVRTIKKYASMGVKVFAIDTFKLSSDADNSQPFWLVMQNQMKEFDELIKPSNLNVSLICTLQLGKGALINRYLTENDLGMSKNVIDVASVCLLIRKVHNDEYEGGKNELKVIMPIAGTSSGREVKLNDKVRHSLIFIAKNRNGEAEGRQIVVMHDLGTLRYKEVGITDVPYGA